MPLPDPSGWFPAEAAARSQFSAQPTSPDDLARRYGLPPGTPVSVIMERLNQDPTYTWGDTTQPPASDAEALARLQGYSLNGQPLTDMISNGQAFITPQGSDASYYYIPDSGPVMTGYTPEQREQIENAQQDARTRGIGTVAALVAGGAALGATPWGSATNAPAAGGATTYPLAGAGGPITATPITAGAGTAAVAGSTAAAGAIPAAAGGAAANSLSNVPKWLDYALPAANALVGSYAADKASDAEVGAMDRALAENARQYDTSRADLMPWLTAGQGALNNLRDSNAFQASPGYEWSRNEGIRDIGNSFAARGGAASGNAMKALAEFQTGLANQDYNNWWNREAGIAGVGQNTAVNLGNLGQSSSNAAGNYFANQGASRASGVLGKYGAVAGAADDIYQNYLYRKRRAA